jgi:DNA-binding NtrC family response regulator
MTLHLSAEPALVVIVDDEPPVLRALERSLRGQSFAVRTTTSPREALEWVRTEKVGLVIADYRMPEMKGTDLLEEVERTRPQTARILLTGYSGESMVVRGLGRGLCWLVGKPWDDGKLIDIIQRFLQAGGVGEAPVGK